MVACAACSCSWSCPRSVGHMSPELLGGPARPFPFLCKSWHSTMAIGYCALAGKQVTVSQLAAVEKLALWTCCVLLHSWPVTVERQGSHNELAVDARTAPRPPFLTEPGSDDGFHRSILGVPHRLRLEAPPDCSFYPEGSGVDCRLQQ